MIKRKSEKRKVYIPPNQIHLTDTLADKNETNGFYLTRGYGGFLFTGHFCLSKTEARKVAKYINSCLREDLRKKHLKSM